MIDTQDRLLDGLAVSGQADFVFWGLLAMVGLIALLVGVKVMFQERRRNPKRRHEWRQR